MVPELIGCPLELVRCELCTVCIQKGMGILDWSDASAVGANDVKTMRRRKLLLGMGSLAATGAAGLGTGAFDTAQINDRGFEATVRVDSNSNQLLRLNPNSQYATTDGNGKLLISIDALAQDAEYTFSDLFRVENNGRNNVLLSVSLDDNPDGAITEVTADGSTISGSNSVGLNSGDSVDVGAEVVVGDGTGTFDGSFTIHADEP